VLSTEMEEIGNEAFDGCINLKTINLDKIKTIGKNAFVHCFALTSVDLSSVVTLGDQCSNYPGPKSDESPGFTDITVKDTMSVVLRGGNDSVSVLSYLKHPPSVTFGTRVSFNKYTELRQLVGGDWTEGVTFINVAPKTVLKTVFAGGDPYIYPLNGQALKLPNTEDVYRLYQDDQVIINAQVGRATPAIQREIEALLGPGGAVISAQAHFFTHIHIACLGESLTYDLEHRTVSSDAPQSTFSVGSPFVSTTDVPYDAGLNNSRVCIPIRWGTDMCLQIIYSANPQVRNGLSLQGTNVKYGSGLLIRNYRPRLFRLTGLQAAEPVVLPKNMKRVTSNRGTSGHQEYTMLMKQ
jgi:hypothetical protein